MRRTATWLMAVVLGSSFGVSVLPSRAEAYCRTRVDSTKARKNGEPVDSSGCNGTGNQLFWRSSCISYQLYPQVRLVSLNETRRIVAEAFAKWTQTSCPLQEQPGKNPDARISLDVRDLGETECAKAGNPADKAQSGYNKEGPNQNVIIFRDNEWPYRKNDEGIDDQSRTLGLTTVTFDGTGEIRDADMELNTYDTKVKVTDIGPDDYDLASIITHEAGHFLGIAHSTVDLSSTMYSEYQPGETRKQFLKLDDINAICEAYAPGGIRYSGTQQIAAGACDPTPQGGVQRSCDDESGGCVAAPSLGAASSDLSPYWATGTLGALGALVAWRRRKNR